MGIETWLLSILVRSMTLLLWAMSSSHDCITKKKLITIAFYDKPSHIRLDGIYLAQLQAHKVLSQIRQSNQPSSVRLNTGIYLRTFNTRVLTLFISNIHLLYKAPCSLGLNLLSPQGGLCCPEKSGRKLCQFVLQSLLQLTLPEKVPGHPPAFNATQLFISRIILRFQ